MDELAKHYAAAVRTIAHLMPACLKPDYDPEDFVQDAVLELRPDQYGLLPRAAKFRMIDAARSPRARMVQFDHDKSYEPQTGFDVEFSELLEKKLKGFASEIDKEILRMLAEGYTSHEIASRTGIGLRVVQRKMRLIRAIAQN